MADKNKTIAAVDDIIQVGRDIKRVSSATEQNGRDIANGKPPGHIGEEIAANYVVAADIAKASPEGQLVRAEGSLSAYALKKLDAAGDAALKLWPFRPLVRWQNEELAQATQTLSDYFKSRAIKFGNPAPEAQPLPAQTSSVTPPKPPAAT
jgi:hypothetical protein